MTENLPQGNCSAITPSQDGHSYCLEDFAYELPPELIAKEPLPVRHESRLMQIERSSSSISHHHFGDLISLLKPGDLLVLNDTRVIPARLLARRQSGGLVQFLLLKPEAGQSGLWQAMATPLRKLKAGEVLMVETTDQEPVSITVKEIVEAADGQKRVLLNLGRSDCVHSLLSKIGYAPLPPYIQREPDTERRGDDLQRYQTVYAQAPGAVAAPTAGLHFSHELLDKLRDCGIETCTITLHVGPGTFKPITTSLEKHSIESESFSISESSAQIINSTLEKGRRVIAVGTTSCRALETAGESGRIMPTQESYSRLYIRPGYSFKITGGLITNFHLSLSSLLVLVASFAGHSLIMSAYRQAIEERYRFYSYGDAMVIL